MSFQSLNDLKQQDLENLRFEKFRILFDLRRKQSLIRLITFNMIGLLVEVLIQLLNTSFFLFQ